MYLIKIILNNYKYWIILCQIWFFQFNKKKIEEWHKDLIKFILLIYKLIRNLSIIKIIIKLIFWSRKYIINKYNKNTIIYWCYSFINCNALQSYNKSKCSKIFYILSCVIHFFKNRNESKFNYTDFCYIFIVWGNINGVF